MVAARKPHVGGQQLPLLTPATGWVTPSSLPDLSSAKLVAIDTETCDRGLQDRRGPGWATNEGYVCGVSVAWAGGSLYAPVQHPDSECLDREVVGNWLRSIYASPARKVFHNGPYDTGWIRADWGLKPPEMDDTGAMATMIDENRVSYDLDGLCREAGLPGKDERLLREAMAAYGLTDVKADLHRLPARYVGDYAAQDASATLGLFENYLPLLEEQGLLAAYKLDMDLLPLTHEMRLRGIRVDEDRAQRGIDELLVLRDNMLTDISRRLGERVTLSHIRDWKFMQRIYDAENLPYSRTEKLKQPSFKAADMRKLDHWFPLMAAQVEQLTDGADKFLKTYILGHVRRGRIHASINSFKSDDGGAKTHRLSYSNPPLQQMTSRDKMKNDEISPVVIAAVRGSLLPEPGELWCSPDFSQQEYRMIVHYAVLNKLPRSEIALAAYTENPRTDYHQLVADMTGLPRNRAKDCNFAKSYGAGVEKFSAMTGLSIEESQRVIDTYDDMFPFVKKLGEKCKSLADQRGHMRLLDGARCHYDRWELCYTRRLGSGATPQENAEIARERVPLRLEAARAAWPGKRLRRAFTKDAMNALIQGGSARQTKLAMRECWRAGIVPLLQMHDELDLSVADERTGEYVAEIMRSVVRLEVPTVVDVEYGDCWANAKYTWEEARAKWPRT